MGNGTSEIRPRCGSCRHFLGSDISDSDAGCARKQKPADEQDKELCAYFEGKNPGTPLGPAAGIAYVDGSYNAATKRWGYGAVLIAGGTRREFSGSEKENAEGGWQIQGELTAALRVCEEAKAMGCSKLEIRYDYEGVEQWALGRWKTKHEYAFLYAQKMEEYSRDMDISFRHIPSHSGESGNEHVDELAKLACDISPPVPVSSTGKYSPAIPDDINPRCRQAIIEFYSKNSRRFRDYAALKTFGLDPYSRMGPKALDEYAINEGVKDTVTSCLGGDDKMFSSCIRWMMRGLLPEDAVRKAQVDAEVAANCGKKGR